MAAALEKSTILKFSTAQRKGGRRGVGGMGRGE